MCESNRHSKQKAGSLKLSRLVYLYIIVVVVICIIYTYNLTSLLHSLLLMFMDRVPVSQRIILMILEAVFPQP